MGMYRLKAPFMTKTGQFEKGKQTLVVGVLESVLLLNKADDMLFMTMGKASTVYKQTYGKLLESPHTVWVNPSQKRVRIIPLSSFMSEKEPAQVKKVNATPNTEELLQGQLDWFNEIPERNPQDINTPVDNGDLRDKRK